MLEIIQTAIISAVALSLGAMLVKSMTNDRQRKDWLCVVKGVRLWMVPVAALAIILTIAVAAMLYMVPGLSWGWWSMIGGEGNLLLGQTGSNDSGADGPSLLTPVLAGLGIALPVGLLAAVPLLALGEEDQFRYRTAEDSWPQVLWTSLKFGLVHLIVGIPIAAGLALTIAGLTYHLVYRRARNRHLAELVATRPARVKSLTGTIEAEALRQFEVEYIWLRDELEAEQHGVFVAASFHTVWNWLLVSLLLALVVVTWS